MSNTLYYNGYHATIEFDADDGLFIGSVIGVQDSLNFHGLTVDELKNSFHDCIDNYLAMCKEIGKSPDKEYKGSFNVRISSELHRSAEIEAKKEGISLNQFVQNAIEIRLDSLKPKFA